MIQAQPAFAEAVTRVVLFGGQFNMVGSDAHAERIDEVPTFLAAGADQSDVLYSDILGNGDETSKGWVPLNPLRSFGPEVTFARRVKQQMRGPIAIIKSAVGGTTMAFGDEKSLQESARRLLKLPTIAGVPDFTILRNAGRHRYVTKSYCTYAVETEPGVSALVTRLFHDQLLYTPNVRGVRTEEWKLVRYPHGDGDLNRHLSERYHVACDPDERCNLINDPRSASIAAQLRCELDRLMRDVGISEDKVPLNEGIKQQLPDEKMR